MRGYEIRIVQNDGRIRRLRFGGQKMGNKQIRQIVGAMLSVPFGKKPRFELTLDFLAVIEPGPRLEKWFEYLLEFAAEREDVTVDGQKLTRYRFPTYHIFGVVDYQQTIFLRRDGKRWVFGSDPETMKLAPRLPLSATQRYREARARVVAGTSPVLFGMLDVHQTWRMFRNLWPLALVEVAEDAGMADWRSIAFGIEIHDGGLRESVAVMLDPKAVGFWTLLDALPPGMKSPKFTPPGALAFVGSKHEIRVFRNRMEAVMEELAPGSFEAMEGAMARYVAQGGYHWQDDMLRAPGDELALMLMPPLERGGLPRLVLGADYRNEEAMQSVVVKFRRQLERWASYDSQDVRLAQRRARDPVARADPAAPDVRARARPRVRIVRSAHARAGDRDVGASRAPSRWRSTTPCFARTVRALCGGEPTEFMALAYLNLTDLVGLLHGWNRGIWPRTWFARDEVERHRPRHAASRRRGHGAATSRRRRHARIALAVRDPAAVGELVDPRSHRGVPASARARAAEREEREAIRSRSLAPDAAYLGATLQRSPVVVLSTAEEAPAREAGLEKGDVIVRIGGEEIKHLDDLRRVLLAHKPRETSRLPRPRAAKRK